MAPFGEVIPVKDLPLIVLPGDPLETFAPRCFASSSTSAALGSDLVGLRVEPASRTFYGSGASQQFLVIGATEMEANGT